MGDQTFLPLDEPFVPVPVRSAPRVWLRRVRLFGAPGQELRSLELGPGLNVVWAPDADPEERVGTRIGHGAGKTLLCRMLRHALGEPDLASPDDAAALRSAFPEGSVEAEVVVDGAPWAVRRSFDPKAGSRAAPGPLEALETEDAGDYARFVGQLRETLGESARTLAPSGDPWLTALAWASRDQERRFGGALRWRDRAATPASKLARNPNVERARAIRSLLRLRTDEDVAAEEAVHELEQAERRCVRRLAEREREVAFLSLRLEREGRGDARALVEQPLLRQATLRELEAELAALDAAEASDEKVAARRHALEEARCAEAVAAARLADLERVAHDDDCGLCHAPADAAHPGRRDRGRAAARAVERQRRALARAEKAVARARAKLEDEAERAHARQRKRRVAWAEARERLGRARELARHIERRAELTEELDRVRGALADARTRRDRALRAHAAQLGRVADVFDFVVRRLAGQDARGRLAVSAAGLEAGIRLPDGRPGTSPALRVLETLALDLTALVLASEERADLPGLWIHDSPREADLARSHYDALYRLVAWLADVTPSPGFQYLVTTTTRPPSSVAYHTIRLGAARHEDLLLRRPLRR
ncbi:MAG TPA: hypothetical protein RMH99_11475 [Sandaracinaceae bacterium LLY-WYZ-13_1]|nr:hypothetical protein [Sandaracinaceae bacterium LLY-WYZ-13_1]